MIRDKKELEALAKLTLESVCGYPSGCLKCDDKPDLQDETYSYGIEVVEDCYENEKKAERILTSIWSMPYSDIDQKKLSKYEASGGTLKVSENKILTASLGSTSISPDHLIETIKKKIQKLNAGGYHPFVAYGLYVFVGTTYLWDSYVLNVIDEITRIKNEKNYKIIYLDIGFEICICDIESKTYVRKNIDKELRNQLDEQVKV